MLLERSVNRSGGRLIERPGEIDTGNLGSDDGRQGIDLNIRSHH
jgi:hypothetical protein